MVGNKAKQGWDLFKQPKVLCSVNGLSSYQMWLSCNSDIPDANMTPSASCLAVIDLCLCRIGDLSYLSSYTVLCTYLMDIIYHLDTNLLSVQSFDPRNFLGFFVYVFIVMYILHHSRVVVWPLCTFPCFCHDYIEYWCLIKQYGNDSKHY